MGDYNIVLPRGQRTCEIVRGDGRWPAMVLLPAVREGGGIIRNTMMMQIGRVSTLNIISVEPLKF